MQKFHLILLAFIIVIAYSFKSDHLTSQLGGKWCFCKCMHGRKTTFNLPLIDNNFVVQFYPGYIYSIKVKGSLKEDNYKREYISFDQEGTGITPALSDHQFNASIIEGQLVLEDQYEKGVKYYFKEM